MRIILGPAAIVLIFSASALSAENNPIEVVSPALFDVGTKSSTRPAEIISESDLKTADRGGIQDGLNTLGGLQVRTTGSPAISIRGSLNSARTLVLSDGIPLNFSDGVGFNPLLIAEENLGEVAILKGPGSSLFGRDAMAGVIDFRSRNLSSPLFRGSVGSFTTSSVFAGAPFRLGEHSLGQITAYQTHSDGNFPFRISRNGNTGTRTRNDSETTRTTWRLMGTSETLDWSWNGLLAQQTGSTPGPEYSRFPQTFKNWAGLTGEQITFKPGSGWAIPLRITSKVIEQRYDGQSTGRTTSLSPGVAIEKQFESIKIQVFNDASFEKLEASYLADGGKTQNLNEAGFSVVAPVAPRWVVQAAGRLALDKSIFIPSLGLACELEDRWHFFAQYAEGYHPADLTQKYSSSPFYVGNPALNPERSTETSFGLSKSWEIYKFEFEYFIRETRELVESVPVSTTTSTPMNVGKARASGAEASLVVHFKPFDFTGRYEFLENSKVDPIQPLQLSPSHQASLGVVKKWIKFEQALQVTYWSTYYGSQYPSPTLVELGPWATVDLFSEFKPAPDFTLRLSVLNLFDQARELTVGYPEPQRQFKLTGEYSL